MTYKDNKKSHLYEPAEGYDLYSKFYDERNDFLNSFEQDKLFTLIGNIAGKKVLDLGCGTGRLIPHLKEEKAIITAVDVSKEMLKRVSKRFRDTEVVEADAENLPFEENTFDMVIAAFVIVHLKDLQKMFEEVYKVLKPGGIFIVTNINQRKPPTLKTKDVKEIIIRSFYHRKEDVRNALEEAFFSIDKEEIVYEGKTWINQIIRAVK